MTDSHHLTRDRALHVLDGLITDGTQQVADLNARVEAGRQREKALAAAVDEAQAAYRSTNDGIAESIRAIEVAVLSGVDRRTIRGMQRRHRQAEDLSEAEYLRRTLRWGHKPGDGPVRGCPVGDHHALRAHLMRDTVLASYRHDPAVDTVKVKVFRPGIKGCHTFVVVPTRNPITLTYVFEHVLTDRQLADRVLARLRLPANQYWLAAQPAAPSDDAAADTTTP